MRLKLLIPTRVVVDQEVNKIIADAEDGSMCLLPRHIDFLTALAPGILCFEDHEGNEQFAAIDDEG